MMLPFHQLADLFPLIEGAEFDALVADVCEHGIRERIVLLDRQVVDGRNRYRALQRLVETGAVLGKGWGHRSGERLTESALASPQNWFAAYNHALDGEPLAWVISKNLTRRHLDEGQRAFVAAKIANIKNGGDRRSDQTANLQSENVTRATAAKLLNVSERAVNSAKVVQDRGSPELQDAVARGSVAVSTAAILTKLPEAEQSEIVAKGEKEILSAAKVIRARQRETRFVEVNEKLAQISEGSKPLPTGQQFPIIYADPATKFLSGFNERSIENHYPTMTQDELLAMPVRDLAMPVSLLAVWTTVPQLRNTMDLIDAWGFKYVSSWCWDKVDPATGYWGFNQHELLLFATRGEFPAPLPGTQPRSLYREKKTDHSAKPAWFAEQIEKLWPSLPKIELFARPARPGWHAWGNQSGITYTEIDAARGSASAASGDAAELPAASPPPSLPVDPAPASPIVPLRPAPEAPLPQPPAKPVNDGLDIPEFLRRRRPAA